MHYAPYSFSKINCFEHCQKQFEFTYVNKISPDVEYRDPIFFQRGRFIHTYIAHRLNGGAGEVYGYNNVDIEDKLKLIEDAEKTLENEYVSLTLGYKVTCVEKEIRLDSNLLPTNGAYIVNGYIDYYAVNEEIGTVIDWKSGTYRPTQKFKQLELYALWIFQTYPKIKEVDLLYYFIEDQKYAFKTVTLEDVIELRNNLSISINTIESTKVFELNPSKSCEYCKFVNTCRDKYNIDY
jgi:CRISPR/Cas system-associated exonuclease Cas4 (RecB family)